MRKIFQILFFAMALCASASVTRVVQLDTKLVPAPAMDVTVITPEGFPAGTRFPVVYLLNGYSGNHNDWTKIVQPKLGDLADKYGMVMVMPDGRDSWYWDAPNRPDMKMESFIIKELVPYIDANFPTIPDPKKRAITGLSMGGQGAMWLAMRHPDIFGSVGSTSGGLDIRPFPTRWKMSEWLGPMESNEKTWDEHAIISLVPTLTGTNLNIIFDCGTDDFFAEVNDNLHIALLAAGIPHDYISRPGNHSHTYWRNAILYQLLFFNEAFSK